MILLNVFQFSSVPFFHIVFFVVLIVREFVTNWGMPASAGVRRDRRWLIRVSQKTQTQSGDGIMI